MHDETNPPDAASILTCLNPRRFELLLHAGLLGGVFTVAELRAAVPASHAASIARDVAAMETHGLLFGDPPASMAPRQGYTVSYRLAPYVPDLFDSLAVLVRDACVTA